MESPSDEIFNDIKEACKRVWNTKDNTYGYVTEKLERVDSLTNNGNEIVTCYRMFDSENQRLMRHELSSASLSYIYDNL